MPRMAVAICVALSNEHAAMSKRLDCFMAGCDATIEADTEAGVMAQVEEHVASTHPDLELDEETVQTVRDHIQDV